MKIIADYTDAKYGVHTMCAILIKDKRAALVAIVAIVQLRLNRLVRKGRYIIFLSVEVTNFHA